MDLPAKDVPVGRFFVTADPPPNNVFIMRRAPRMVLHGRKKAERRQVLEDGLCQNINTDEYMRIDGRVLVRLLAEAEHNQTHFVGGGLREALAATGLW
jgi:hypothetical protein